MPTGSQGQAIWDSPGEMTGPGSTGAASVIPGSSQPEIPGQEVWVEPTLPRLAPTAAASSPAQYAQPTVNLSMPSFLSMGSLGHCHSLALRVGCQILAMMWDRQSPTGWCPTVGQPGPCSSYNQTEETTSGTFPRQWVWVKCSRLTQQRHGHSPLMLGWVSSSRSTSRALTL